MPRNFASTFAKEENRPLFAALDGGELLERKEGLLRIRLPDPLALRRLQSRSVELERTASRFLGRPVRVVLEAPASDPAPAAAPGLDPEAVRARRQEALRHPAVNDALEILGGELLEIRPLADR